MTFDVPTHPTIYAYTRQMMGHLTYPFTDYLMVHVIFFPATESNTPYHTKGEVKTLKHFIGKGHIKVNKVINISDNKV